MMIKVIIQASYAPFIPPKKYKELLESKGYSYWGEMAARTDENLIAYIEQHCDNGRGLMGGKDKWGHSWGLLIIEEVDTSRPWFIDEYDGAENIQYIDYDIVIPELNYCKFKN